jgi:hypothetical protein
LTVRSWDVIVRLGALCAAAGWVGAGDGIRTRDINLGKVALYQLSYSRARSIAYANSLHCPAPGADCQMVKRD